MSAADWYARKLGRGAPAQPVAPRQSTPPTGPAPWQPPPYQPPHQPGTPYQEQPPQVPEEVAQPGDESWFQTMAKRGAAGKATPVKKANEVYRCPECGSNNFFTMAGDRKFMTMGPSGLVPPAPMCTECGYNGLFEQFGNQPEIVEGNQ